MKADAAGRKPSTITRKVQRFRHCRNWFSPEASHSQSTNACKPSTTCAALRGATDNASILSFLPCHSSIYPILGDDRLVKFDAQAWAFRDRHATVDEGRQVSNQAPHERRRTKTILNQVSLGTRSHPMKRSRKVDPRAEAMGDTAASGAFGHARDFPRHRKAP